MLGKTNEGVQGEVQSMAGSWNHDDLEGPFQPNPRQDSMRTGESELLYLRMKLAARFPFPQIAFGLHVQLTDSRLSGLGWEREVDKITSVGQMVWQTHSLAWPLLVENRSLIALKCWHSGAFTQGHEPVNF